MNKVKKKLSTMQIMDIVAYYNNVRNNKETKDKFNLLPFKVQFALRNNVNILQPIAENFEEFRDEAVKNIQEKYFNDDKSEKQIIKDENNQEQEMLSIKEEYRDDYTKEISKLDQEITEMLFDDNEVGLNVCCMETIFENLPDDCNLNIDDIDMLMFMNE